MATRYEIYPPIGIARVGNSGEWSIGPEIPGKDPIPEGGFKDAQHRIKRFAQRFRIYEFTSNGRVREITRTQGIEIKWTVHVANHKASWVTFRGQYRQEQWKLRNGTVQPWPSSGHSFGYCETRDKLIVDSGRVPISGTDAGEVPLKGQFWGSGATPREVKLGALRTDHAGRLIVIPGEGIAYSLDAPGGSTNPDDQPNVTNGMDNDNWIDTVFDGHVNATVTINGIKIECTRATIISAPPHYANGAHCVTSIYDLIEDIYERQKRSNPHYNVGPVVYYEHIDPLFKRLYLLSWTNELANRGHNVVKMHQWFGPQRRLYDPTGPAAYRRTIFNKIRFYVVKDQPEQIPTNVRPTMKVNAENEEKRRSQTGPEWMPPLAGDDGDVDNRTPDKHLSLTQLQYERLKKWVDGDFTTGSPHQPPAKFDDIPVEDQPRALRFASLEWSIGGALYPGIEFYWIAEFGQMYDLTKPFRFGDLAKPGHLTRGLSLPWQADFYMCRTHWWPSVRPDDVVDKAYFERIKSEVPPDQLAASLTDRQLWTRGFQGPHRNGPTEMVKKWFKLGFISSVQYEDSKEKPILVEEERDIPEGEAMVAMGESVDETAPKANA